MSKKMLILCIALSFSGMVSAQGAFYLPEFISEFNLKSEATLKVGPAIPSAAFKNQVGENGIPQGAKIGFGADLSYNYYFVPYFGLGLALGGEWFGYDFNTALSGVEKTGKLKTNGWSMYSLGVSLNVRIPIISKLYLIGNVQGQFGLLATPSAKTVEEVPRFNSKGKEIRPGKIETSLMRTNLKTDFILGGEIGLQYRIIKNVLAQVTAEYRYFVSANSHKNQQTNPVDSPKLEFRYSAFVVNFGVSYAF